VLGSNFLLNLGDINRVFRKVRKTQHQNLEFRPKPGEMRKKKTNKTAAKKYISLQGGRGVKLRKEPFFWGGKLSFILFSPSISFFLSASTAATYVYFHCCYLYDTIISSNLIH
jgi:hypothetical protein